MLRGLSFIPGEAVVVFSGSRVWLLDPADLSVRAQASWRGAMFMIAGQLVGVSYSGELVSHVLEGSELVVQRREQLPIHSWAGPDKWIVGGDGGVLGFVSNVGGGLLIDWREGASSSLPPDAKLLAVAGREALWGGPDSALCAVTFGGQARPLVATGAGRACRFAARVAGGWVYAEWDSEVAAARILTCVDEAGRVRWSRHLSWIIVSIAAAPSGEQLVVLGYSHALVINATDGQADREDTPLPYISDLLVVEDRLLVMGYTRKAPTTADPISHVFDLQGRYVEALPLQRCVAAGASNALCGVGWMGGRHQIAMLELRALTQPPATLGPSSPLFVNLCAARGHVYYDRYAAGAWALVHAGPDTSGAWREAQLDTLKRCQSGPRVIASEAAGLVAATNGAGHTVVYEAETGEQRWMLEGLTKGRAVGAFSPDGAALILANQSKIFCWDMATGEERWRGKTGAELWYSALVWGGAGFLVMTQRGALMVFDVATGALRATAQLDLPKINAIAVSAADQLFMGCESYQLYVAQLPAMSA